MTEEELTQKLLAAAVESNRAAQIALVACIAAGSVKLCAMKARRKREKQESVQCRKEARNA